jgi:hypothetical protein
MAKARAKAVPQELLAPAGYVQITGLATAKGIGPVPAGSRRAVVQAEAQAVRWRDDGTAPTASVGMTLAVGTSLTFEQRLDLLSFIEQVAGAKLNVTFYKEAGQV